MYVEHKKPFFMNVFLAIALTLISIVTVRAQQNPETGPVDGKQRSDDVERLRSKVEQLERLVEQQQRALAEMRSMLNDVDGRVRLAALVTPTKSPDSEAVQPVPPLDANQIVTTRQVQTAVNQSSRDSTPQNAPKTADKGLVSGWDNRSAFLRSADGAFETRVTGFAQFDSRVYSEGNHPPNTFVIRRARIALEGQVERYFNMKVEGDFSDTTGTLLRDFYVNVHRFDEIQVRFGQFKEPFSQEELRLEPNQDFVERSLVNLLAPSRSPGLMVSGVIDQGVFEYQVGSFNGKGLLANNNTGTPESAGRLRFAPWKNGSQFWLKGFSFGGAYAQGRSNGGASLSGQTSSRSFTFFTPESINGKITRSNGEFTWTMGPAALRAEFDQVAQQRTNLGLRGADLPGVVSKGYMAQFTYLLTGETKSENGGTTPKHNLFSKENGKLGLGAFELKARYDDLQINDGTAKSNRAQSVYFGTSWYLNRFVKHLLDFGFERFDDPLRSPNPARRNYFVILNRFTVAF